MSDITVTYAGWDSWDRIGPLLDGRVKPDGLSLKYVSIPLHVIFRMVAHGEQFDVAEMSFSTYTNLISRGDRRYIGIPVFPSRNFRHGYIYVNSKSGINEPKDLRGKRVGVFEYQMTAALWQRCLLRDDYGLEPAEMNWYEGGLTGIPHDDRNPIPDPPGVKINRIPDDKALDQMLAAGELDALMGPSHPAASRDGSGRVRRLFPNYVEVEQDYYRRTKFFPIMHMVVIRRDLYESNKWMAPSLVQAFTKSKQLGWERLRVAGTLSVMLPWLMREIEEIGSVMGDKFWPYGFRQNYDIADYMCRQSYEQGLSNERQRPEDLFAPEVFDPSIGD